MEGIKWLKSALESQNGAKEKQEKRITFHLRKPFWVLNTFFFRCILHSLIEFPESLKHLESRPQSCGTVDVYKVWIKQNLEKTI